MIGDYTAVVPTTGRSTVRRAIDSALDQSLRPREVIVVQCGSSADVIVSTREVRLLRIDRMNANAARMHGIGDARSGRVALLDDDDAWRPSHLAVADSLLSDMPDQVVTSARVAITCSRRHIRVAPTEIYTAGEIGDYLFDVDTLRFGRRLLHTSTLTFARDLVQRVPWQEDLPRHQDWDWVLRASSHARFVQSPETTCNVEWGAGSSVSRTTAWRTSLDWTERALRDGLISRASAAAIRIYVTSDLAWSEGDRSSAFKLALAELGNRPQALRAAMFWLARTARHLRRTTR